MREVVKRAVVAAWAYRAHVMVGAVLLAAAVLRLLFLSDLAQHPFMLAPQGGRNVLSLATDYSAFDNSALYLAGRIRNRLSLPPLEQRHPRARYFFTEARRSEPIEARPAKEYVNHPNELYFRPPLYMYFLGALYVAFGDNQIAIRLIQGAVGLCNALLAYALARRLGGRIAAFFALAVGAFYWPLIIYENVHHDKTVVIFCLLLMAHCAFRWTERRTPLNAAVLGAMFGITLYGAPALTLFIPFLALWMMWVVYRKDSARAMSAYGMLRPVLMTALGLGLVFMPFVVRNYYITGRPYLLAANGVSLGLLAMEFVSEGDIHELRGALGPYWDDEPEHQETVARLDLSLDIAELDQNLRRMAWPHILSHPQILARRCLTGALLFWSPKENHGLTMEYLIEYPMRLLSPSLDRLPGNFTLVFIPFILGLGLLCRAWLRTRMAPRVSAAPEDGASETSTIVNLTFLMLLIAVWYAPYILLGQRALYRIPLAPLMSVVGAWGFARAFACARARHWRALAFSAAPAAILLPIMLLVPVSYESDVTRWFRVNVAVLQERGRPDEAMAVAQRIADSRPHYADVQNETAVLLVNHGKESEALRYYLRALNAMPASRTDLADHVANQITRLLLQFEEQMDTAPLYQNILDDYGNEYSTMIALARSFLLREAPDKAMLFLEAAQGAEPVDAAYEHLLQEARDALGRI